MLATGLHRLSHNFYARTSHLPALDVGKHGVQMLRPLHLQQQLHLLGRGRQPGFA
jgi:hypothetical protein